MKKISTLLTLLSFILVQAIGQTTPGAVKGSISTSDNKPAEGVTVYVRGTNKIVIADNNGDFKIDDLAAGDYILVVSLVGQQDQEQAVNVESGKTSAIKIQLQLSNRELTEVVVVANKSAFKTNRLSSTLRLPSSILETPQSIQVVTGKLINDQQIFDMLEGVTRNVSGVTRVEHWDNYARIYARGSQVAAFRNGMNMSTTWGPLTEDMSMVERVEFVKGPAGFMLANGNPAGLYNVVTKKPSGRTKGEFDVTLGSFGLYRSTLDLDGKLSKDGRLLYRLNVMGETKNSQRDFEYRNKYAFAPVLKYLVDDKTSVTLEYTQQFMQQSVIGSNYVFSKRKYADLPRDASMTEPNIPPTNMTERNLLAVFEHKINGKWKLTAQGTYDRYTQIGSSVWPVLSAFSPANDSIMQRGMSIWDILGITKIGQVYLNGEAATGSVTHRILAGIDKSDKMYYHDWNQSAKLGDSINIYKPVYGLATIPTWDRSKDIRERGVQYHNAYSAFYVQDELGFFDNRLRLTVAGRYTTLIVSPTPTTAAIKPTALPPAWA
ncbi:MAG: TonB-dependent receptor [Bacteroidetes bacterium]|nr:TonB-dependent receptor [Bacteroidota bacterium]